VHPLDVQHEVLVLLVAAEDANRTAGADQQAVLELPGVISGVDVVPAGEVATVERVDELQRRRRGREAERQRGEDGNRSEAVEHH
jgi:hypothetical protein